jgi:pseudaminic acid synthase
MSVFIIAELSANHNQDLTLALETVRAAAKAGADAVKVQTFRPESLALDVDNPYFGPKTEGAWKGWRPWDLYQKAAMPYEWHQPIQQLAIQLGMEFFSSPFDLEAVDFLESLHVPRYKIASFEINDIPLIKKAAQTGKPMILSTGVASLQDIELAIQTCRDVGNDQITLLKCTSEYPARIEEANLSKMVDMQQRFGVKVGISDHTAGSFIPSLAVALGAQVIEKHLILNRSLGGLDASFSMEPDEFADMVQSARLAEKCLGTVDYQVNEADQRRKRSLFAVRDIPAGEVLSAQNLRSLRPCVGLEPKHYESVIGHKVNQTIRKGTPMRFEYLLEKEEK